MRCRQPRYKPDTWTELVDSGMDEMEIVLAMLAAADEHIDDCERSIAELRARIAELEGE